MVSEKVIEIIAGVAHLPRERISLDSTFAELEISSLEGLEVLFCLEEAFNLSIPDEIIQDVQSVGEVVERLERHLSVAGASPAEPAQA